MRRVFNYIGLAVAFVLVCGSCTQSEQMLPAEQKCQITVKATAFDDDSRATINDNYASGNFSGSWQSGDALSVYATLNGKQENAKFSYNAQSDDFSGSITAGTGSRSYYAVYPYSATTNAVPFGRDREQSGNTFNSAYDVMVSQNIAVSNGAAGEGANGGALSFDMQRMTAIFAPTLNNAFLSTAIEAMILSATKPISANSLVIDGQSATLSSDGQSKHIIVYPTDQTMKSARTFFNIPAGDYGKLTLTAITTAGNVYTETFDRTGKPIQAGKLYYYSKSNVQYSGAKTSTVTWSGNKNNEALDFATDMSGKCSLYYELGPGLKGMNIAISSISSSVLQSAGLASAMDVVNNSTYIESLSKLGMSVGDDLILKGTFTFDVAPLVEKLISLSPKSSFSVTVTATDFINRELKVTMTFNPAAIYNLTYNNDANLWLNTASLSVAVTNGSMSDATMTAKYRKAGQTTWQSATISGNTINIAPDYSQKSNGIYAYYALTEGTGVYLGNSYEVILEADGSQVASATFAAGGTADTIYNAGMEDWSKHSVEGSPGALVDGSVYWPNTGNNRFWANGNNGQSGNLCTPQSGSDVQQNGTNCAKIKGKYVNYLVITAFATGNLFSGTMEFFGTGKGVASFGQPYTFTGRPSALKMRIYVKNIGQVSKVGSKTPTAIKNLIKENGNKDTPRVFFAIVDWASPHQVVSGTDKYVDTSTFWNPKDNKNPSEGPVIGYGMVDLTQTTSSWVDLVIPACWYDTTTKPSKAYNLVISCATSAYGDYMTGGEDTEIYLEDFEWVY